MAAPARRRCGRPASPPSPPAEILGFGPQPFEAARIEGTGCVVQPPVENHARDFPPPGPGRRDREARAPARRCAGRRPAGEIDPFQRHLAQQRLGGGEFRLERAQGAGLRR